MSRKEPTDAEWRVMAVEGIEAGEPPMWPRLVIRLLDRLDFRPEQQPAARPPSPGRCGCGHLNESCLLEPFAAVRPEEPPEP